MHNTPEPFTCDSFMAQLVFWGGVALVTAVLAAVLVGIPLYFGSLQFSDFFSLGRSLWAGRTGS